MHIADGVLPTSVIFSTFALSSAGIAYSLRKIHPDDLPKIAVVTASFFVASLIHLPLGPTSVHLLLPGLVGILLGPAAAFLSITIGLVLQAILFQFGGLTALGANSLMTGVPAVLCGLFFFRFQGTTQRTKVTSAALAGGLGTLLAALLLAGLLYTSGESFFRVAQLAVVAHIPIIFIEALVSAATVSFIFRVKPEMLHWSRTLVSPHDAAS